MSFPNDPKKQPQPLTDEQLGKVAGGRRLPTHEEPDELTQFKDGPAGYEHPLEYYLNENLCPRDPEDLSHENRETH